MTLLISRPFVDPFGAHSDRGNRVGYAPSPWQGLKAPFNSDPYLVRSFWLPPLCPKSAADAQKHLIRRKLFLTIPEIGVKSERQRISPECAPETSLVPRVFRILAGHCGQLKRAPAAVEECNSCAALREAVILAKYRAARMWSPLTHKMDAHCDCQADRLA